MKNSQEAKGNIPFFGSIDDYLKKVNEGSIITKFGIRPDTLSLNRTSEESFRLFLTALETNTHLQTINLFSCILGDERAKALANTLKQIQLCKLLIYLLAE